MSSVVRRFLLKKPPDRGLVQITIDDAEHYSPGGSARDYIASYPAWHEREAPHQGHFLPLAVAARISIARTRLPWRSLYS
ncbi:hypothetical protein [Xylella fastidiosa]|uniref:hypothetical protein n=1 Tax=Xylella fastidiosa TaxID=2371 RepID=UPI0039850A15